jgi:hypothetical protein
LLEVPASEVDALHFTQLVREARAALHQGRAAEARATFKAAFGLWRTAGRACGS